MSDSKGLYVVPENIRKMKPRGTMVKKIKGHYYVYPKLCYFCTRQHAALTGLQL
jgi:hypothetical protein